MKADTTIGVRISDVQLKAMREMAACLGFVKPSGEPNVGEYLRSMHDMAIRLYEQGMLRRQVPLVLVEKPNGNGELQGVGDVQDL